MIDRAALLSDLQALLKRFETDLLERSESADIPDVGQTLHAEYDRAKQAERTAQNYEDWRSDAITQAAAAWVLSCLFVRFLEDNRLIDPPKIAGPKVRLQQARDEHELYFREHPKETDREYLLAVFDELAKLPGTKDVFGEHNPIHELPNWLSGDAAGELMRFFQKIDANTGNLIHDFTDPQWDTRFLGDLYQDLSEAARKKYALLQTPEFVEEFILNRTLDPALAKFGLDATAVTDNQGKPVTDPGFRMIDPACGSGHFLLGAFHRILDRWQKKEPVTNVRELVQRTLNSIHGVDVNPYAVAIARFRLLLAALKACGIHRLKDSPIFELKIACGDSLLHAPLLGGQQVLDFALRSTAESIVECDHAYSTEDLVALKHILRGGQYHAIVANPPYIIVKDRATNAAYRKRYASCKGKYSLAAPFMQRLFELGCRSAFVGQITTNAFMKREFGRILIEEFLPTVDLTCVIDSSGAFIPGHATPTVILFGRSRSPVANSVRAVMGIRGEPTDPPTPAEGKVWSSIVELVDTPDTKNDFVSVHDVPRETLEGHPWSLRGGGAVALKRLLDARAATALDDVIEDIGIVAVTLEDDAFLLPVAAALRHQIPRDSFAEFVEGDSVRDWTITGTDVVLFPYDACVSPVAVPELNKYIWPCRSVLWNRLWFRKTQKERGLKWFEYGHISVDKALDKKALCFPFVASHNHFVFDKDGRIFNRSTPVIKLSPESEDRDFYVLLAVLNSSLACFWMKQVSQRKQLTGGDSVRIESVAKVPYEFASTQLKRFPLPTLVRTGPLKLRLAELGKAATELADELLELSADKAICAYAADTKNDLKSIWAQIAENRSRIQRDLIYIQEEIDFCVYSAFSLLESRPVLELRHSLPADLSAGKRPFEIICGANIDGFDSVSEIPANWNPKFKEVWEQRIQVIRDSNEIQTIEDANYKRRWIGRQGKYNRAVQSDDLPEACKSWLLDRLETYFDFDGRMNDGGEPTAKIDIELTTLARLADVARQDTQFMEVGQVYRDDTAFDVQRVVEELVKPEHVPLLPVLSYKPSGQRKRKQWENTWELQRQEDGMDARAKLPMDDLQYLTDDQANDLKQREIGDIPAPPKYTSADFISTGGARYWALRGKLDVPKERWVSFPHCEGPDGTLVIAWAGYDHLHLARAISAYYVDIQERLGGRDDPRLVPLLACIIELLPWLKQWHHDLDPDYNQRMDEVFEGFVTEEAKNLGMTEEQVRAWEPPAKAKARKKGTQNA